MELRVRFGFRITVADSGASGSARSHRTSNLSLTNSHFNPIWTLALSTPRHGLRIRSTTPRSPRVGAPSS